MDRNDLIRALRECSERGFCDTFPALAINREGCPATLEAAEMLEWDAQVINGLLEYIEAVSAAAKQIAGAAEEASKRVSALERATAEAADAARMMGIGGEAAENA